MGESDLRSGRFTFTAGTDGATPEAGYAGMNADDGMPRVCLHQLEVLCTYADPNYGFLWFWCRHNSFSQPSEVLQRMRDEFICDLIAGRSLWPYVWAITRSAFGLPYQGPGASACASLAVTRGMASDASAGSSGDGEPLS